MPTPQIRPGKVQEPNTGPNIVAFFPYPALANSVVQWVIQLGIRSDQVAISPPETLPQGRGMLVVIGCPDPALGRRVESICRSQGATIVRTEQAVAMPQASGATPP